MKKRKLKNGAEIKLRKLAISSLGLNLKIELFGGDNSAAEMHAATRRRLKNGGFYRPSIGSCVQAGAGNWIFWGQS